MASIFAVLRHWNSPECVRLRSCVPMAFAVESQSVGTGPVVLKVNNGTLHFLDSVQDIYAMARPVLVSILNPNHYSSRSSPCYGALFVTPDFATYSFETFSRFQDILNRGLRHLPMEHDISVEAFHPEAVSKTTPLDHRFTRSPFPTLHVCYHGLRARHSPLYPKAPRKAVGGTSSSSSRRLGDSKKRRN